MGISGASKSVFHFQLVCKRKREKKLVDRRVGGGD
jgi:hypothetical protein